jgi:hypothetical protein
VIPIAISTHEIRANESDKVLLIKPFSTGRLRALLDPGFVGQTNFVPVLYYLGLELLAAAAFVGAFLSS